MSVRVHTTYGDLVVCVYSDQCPRSAYNFIKLCKVRYYENCLFHSIQRNFLAQTGDPTGTGRDGQSIYGLLKGSRRRFFDDEIQSTLRHNKRGTLSMANAGKNLNGSQFFITLVDGLTSLDDKYTVFG